MIYVSKFQQTLNCNIFCDLKEAASRRVSCSTPHERVEPPTFTSQGRARSRDGAPTPVLGTLSLNPSHRGSAGNRCNAPSRGEVPSRGLQANRCRAMGCGPTAHSRLDAGLKGALMAGVRPYPAREGVRRRSNLKTLHWSVFPREGVGGSHPQS